MIWVGWKGLGGVGRVWGALLGVIWTVEGIWLGFGFGRFRVIWLEWELCGSGIKNVFALNIKLLVHVD